MKSQQLNDELTAIVKNIGISIRREKGNFKSGICLVKEQEFIIFNKNTSLEAMNSILAICLSKHADKIFIKPLVRDFIEKEMKAVDPEKFYLEVNELLTDNIKIEKESKKNMSTKN